MSVELLDHQVFGEGDSAILLLNGGMMTYNAWLPISSGLSRSHRIVGCDFRGQLCSPGKAPQRLIDHLPDLIALLDHLELRRVHVMGTSFGGEIGLLLAAEHPKRVRTLAAVTAVDRTPEDMAENAQEARRQARQVIAGGDGRHFFDAVVADIYSLQWREQHADDLAKRREAASKLPIPWYEGLLGILTAIEDFDLSPCLGKIRCPTLVVHAARDRVMPEERVRTLATAIAGAELQVHPEAGHTLVVEDPDWLVAIYRDFLSRH
ncbi:MAG: alpha/beta fold hydrolase [Acidobacteriota bacterium]